MNKLEILKFGFFFSGSCQTYSALFFTAFQTGQTVSNAHQVVITEVSETSCPLRRVAFTIDPAAVKATNNASLETFCRVAVRQFLDAMASGPFLGAVLPLELSAPPWEGQVLLVG